MTAYSTLLEIYQLLPDNQLLKSYQSQLDELDKNLSSRGDEMIKNHKKCINTYNRKKNNLKYCLPADICSSIEKKSHENLHLDAIPISIWNKISELESNQYLNEAQHKELYLNYCLVINYYETLIKKEMGKLAPEKEQILKEIRSLYDPFWKAFWKDFYPVWESEQTLVRNNDFISLWSVTITLPIIGAEKNKLEKAFKKGFSSYENNYQLNIAHLIDINQSFSASISCSTFNPLKDLISCLLDQLLIKAKAIENRVIFLDYITHNPYNWGNKYADLAEEHGFMLFPTTDGDMEPAINKLKKLNPLNKSHKSDHRWLIVYGFNNKMQNAINDIIANSEYYGVSVIICTIDDSAAWSKRLDLTFNISLNNNESFLSDSSYKRIPISLCRPDDNNIKWDTIKSKYANAYTPPSLDYFDKVSIHKKLPNRLPASERFSITLPFAVDDATGDLFGMRLNRENHAAYILASTGYGKTSVLHMMISYIITHRHPDDVELWLCDLKGNEFNRYSDCTSHVRYILSGGDDNNSKRYINGIVNNISDAFRQRLALTNEYNVHDVSLLPDNIYCPLLVIILDEYSIVEKLADMSRTNGSTSNLIEKIDLILKQARALGIRIIFTSQEYCRNGLSVDNIHIRVSMGRKDNGIFYLDSSKVKSVDTIPGEILPKRYSIYNYTADDQGSRAYLLHHLTFNVSKNANNNVIQNDYISRILSLNNAQLSDFKCLNEREKNEKGFDLVPRSQEEYLYKNPVIRYGVITNEDYYSIINNKNQSVILTAIESMKKRNSNKVHIYVGIPCSFDRTVSIKISDREKENILFIGQEPFRSIETLLSIYLSAWLNKANVELWVPQNGIFAYSLANAKNNSKFRFPKTICGINIMERINELSDSSKKSGIPNKQHFILALDFPTIITELITELKKEAAASGGCSNDDLKKIIINTYTSICSLLHDGPQSGLHFTIHSERLQNLNQIMNDYPVTYDSHSQILRQQLSPDSFEHFLSMTLDSQEGLNPSIMLRQGSERSLLGRGQLLYSRLTRDLYDYVIYDAFTFGLQPNSIVSYDSPDR